MKLLLSIYYDQYLNDPVRNSRGQIINADELTLEQLRQFFREHVWLDDSRDEWDSWVQHVQQRRNAVHAYRDREIGTFEGFFEAARRYRDFISELDRAPYSLIEAASIYYHFSQVKR